MRAAFDVVWVGVVGWEGNPETCMGDRACLRIVGVGGFHAQGKSYKVGVFSMVS